jgi:hypothetical protein
MISFTLFVSRNVMMKMYGDMQVSLDPSLSKAKICTVMYGSSIHYV